MQASHPLRPSPRLPSARPRRAAHPLPRCARSRHCRRPPRSPPLRAAGAQPRAGHLHIHPGEANGPNSNTAPLPGGRRVHLGSACWGGRRCAMSCRHSPRGVGGRASGGSSLLVSRAAAAPFIWSLVLYFRFCIVSRPLASRGAPERHLYCCWLRVRNGLFRFATKYTPDFKVEAKELRRDASHTFETGNDLSLRQEAQWQCPHL